MLKYSELKNSSKYGSVQSHIGSNHKNSSIYCDIHRKQSLIDLNPITYDRKVKWDGPGRKIEVRPVETTTNRGKPKESIKERLKRTVEKIQSNISEARDDILREDSDEILRIGLDTEEPDEDPKIPRELWKTVIAMLLMILNFSISLTTLALVHEYLPDRAQYGPLPDLFLSNVPEKGYLLYVSEYIIMGLTLSTVLVLIFHKHRFVVFRRIFLIMALLYLMRAVTMSVTVLPMCSRTYWCSPKANTTDFVTIAKRVVNLMTGFGLSMNGKQIYCGDFIYSGHTVFLIMCWLLITEYTPRVFFPIHWLFGIVAFVGIALILTSHGHYTIDVVIAYFVTTRVFWIYHTLANNPALKTKHQYNYLSRTWCFRIFQYFEENVKMPIPNQFDWPKKFRR